MARRGFGSIRHLPSGKWQARYTGPDTIEHKADRTFAMQGHAESWLADEQMLISMGTWTPPETRARRKTVPTFANYAGTILERRKNRSRRPLRPLTAQDYEKLLRLHINPAIGHIRIDQFAPADIAGWYDGCCPGRKTSRGKCYDLVRSIFNDAVDDGWIDRNPCRLKAAGKPRRSKDVDALPVDVLLTYLDAVPEHYRAALSLAATCALRSGELRGLRRRDVDLKAGTLHVRQQVIKPTVDHHLVYRFADLKSDAGRRDITVPGFLVPTLAAWIASQPVAGRDALVFPARDGHSPMNDSTLNRNHKKAAAAIGRPNLTIHDLRRTAATLAAEDGATLEELKRLLGHTTADVAMLYQVPSARRDRDRAARLDKTITEARQKIPGGRC
ncbi:site-specific integrase [Acidipropionibacterium jensenii]|uniref:site-specific integrase n=1 Tax=Acidipropionibacterium jensenii TaxID=1749 RepID=UPI00214ACA51|nr:site-specific integrase [Acidipropionibacterium jensenii]